MSNLFKSKFVLGLMIVAAFAFTSTASAAITSTLRLGSNNSQVKELQQGLNSQGFVVSTSGAGSVGSETNYFGSKTASAVKAWQASKGLTADAIFGPASRAAWTGTVSTGGTFPAGCTSSAGFSPLTGVACNSTVGGVTYPAGCTSAIGFSPITGLSCSGASTSQTGPVSASLSSSNPASGTLVAGQATADLAHFTFSGSGTVTAVTLQRIGVSADSTPSNVYLFDGATRLTDAASVSNNGSVTFNVPSGIFTVNGSKTISVRSDIATGTSGQTVGMMLATFATSSGTTTVNLSGNIHSIASATLAAVSAGTVTPTNATLNPGPNVTVWQSTLNISQRDVWMKRVAFRNVGSAPANAFANFKLFVNGVQVATATGLDANGYVTFDMTSAPVMLQSGARVVRVDADIVSGASRTVEFSLRNAADVDFVDSSFGVNITPTSAPWGPAAASTISGATGGTLTIEKDVTSPSSNVTLGGNDVSLGIFKMTAYGEPIKVENLRVAFDGSANIDEADDALRNGRVFVNGVQYGSTATLYEVTAGTVYTTYTLNYTVNPGTPVLVEVRADIYNVGATAIVANDTIQAIIAAGASNAQKVDSLGSLSIPGTAVSGNTLTVASAAVTLTKNATYANQSVSLPAANFKIGSWNVAGSSVEDVLLTTASFDVGGTADNFEAADLTNLYVVVKNAAGVIVSQPAPLATVSATGNAFSINHTLLKNTNMSIELYANLGSAVTVGADFDMDLTLTGTASVSGTAVAPAVVTGQTITSGTASITATADASTPVAGIAYDSQTVTTAAFKFDAVTAGYNVTDITVGLAGTNATTVAQSVQLWDGGTMVASQPGADTVTFNGLAWNIPANTNKVLTVKVVLGSVGVGFGSSSANVISTINAFTATNTSTGVSAVGTGTPTGNNMYVYAATPTVTQVALPSTQMVAGTNTIAKFTVTGNGGTIAWKEVLLDINKSAAPTLASVTLWDVTSTPTQVTAATAFQNGSAGVATTCVADNVFCELMISVGTKVDDNVEQQVSGSKTYEVRATVGGTLAEDVYVSSTLTSNLGYVAPAVFTTADNSGAPNNATFVWSDMSAQSHDTGTADWVSEYSVVGVPSPASWTLTY
jgi:hypothetical protein